MQCGTEEHLLSGMQSSYVELNPTARFTSYWTILVGVNEMLLHFQLAGHKPYALIGEQRGMIR